MMLNLHGCYHCQVCKCVAFQEQDIQEQDVFDDDAPEITGFTHVTFHTDTRANYLHLVSGL